jgi:NADH-quinone oxidoreductase subunit D
MLDVKDPAAVSSTGNDGGITNEIEVERDHEIREETPGATRTMVLNMGPQHPSTHGVLRLLLELDGETIVKAAPDIGYLHTGIEKEFEVKTYQQGVTLTDRIDYLAPLSNNLVYCLAAEKLLGLEIPPLAQWTRVMLAELTRLNSHLVWLGTHAIDIGAMSVFLYCFREREDILRIFEMFSGQRMMTSYFRIGGLALPHPRGWQKRVKDFIDIFPSRVDEYEELLTTNRIWTGRTKGVGYISLEDMLDIGVTGPMLRAAGLKIDLRKDKPYSSYEKFDFEVPTLTANDVFARYQIRIEEMRQSARIIRQALEGMPSGSHQADAPGIVLPDREKMKTQMESLIYHFKIVTEGFRVPEGEVYQVIESPRGEVGCYMVSDGTQKPYRVYWRGPSFGTLQATSRMIEGTLIADVIAAIGSMDFVLGDSDR